MILRTSLVSLSICLGLTAQTQGSPWRTLFEELCVNPGASLSHLSSRAEVLGWQTLPEAERVQLAPDDQSVPFGAWRIEYLDSTYVVYSQGSNKENGGKACGIEVSEADPNAMAAELTATLGIEPHDDSIIGDARMRSWLRERETAREVFMVVSPANATTARLTTVYMSVIPRPSEN